MNTRFDMKTYYAFIFIFAALLSSCAGGQLNTPLVYEKNPQYTCGYAEFFGDYYYPENKNKNNVLSISLFTDSMKINNLGTLTGLGQFLFLEDVFQAPTDTVLSTGTYTVNDTGLPFTVAPGKNDTVDHEVYPIGAYISYYENNAANSTMKTIKSGSFVVSRTGSVYNITCNFKTSDNMDLNGSFKAILPHINQSVSLSSSGIRKKLVYTHK
jgi:hypothetical protein